MTREMGGKFKPKKTAGRNVYYTVTSNVSSSEDSDATVAPDMEGNLKMLEGTSQASQPCSPSFLKPKIKSASINPNFSKISSTGHSQEYD